MSEADDLKTRVQELHVRRHRGESRRRNVVGSSVGPLSSEAFWCGRVACASLSSFRRIVVALSNRAPFWRDSVASITELKCTMWPVAMAAHVDRFYARSFFDDSRRLTRLRFRCAALFTAFSAPIYIARREVTVAIDAIQYLSCRSAAQVL
jgi:hypothetical protein